MNSNPDQPTPVALIENNRFTRNGLILLFENEPDFELVGAYPSCEKAFSDPDLVRAQLIIMDLKLPGMSGIEGVRYLKNRYPGMSIIVCTAYEDNANIFDSISSGAIGFLEKKTPPAELLKILRVVAKGGSPITPGVAQKIRSLSNKLMITPAQSKIKLTKKELEILEKIALGKSYQTVANEISTSEMDLLIMIRKVYQKLHAQLSEDKSIKGGAPDKIAE